MSSPAAPDSHRLFADVPVFVLELRGEDRRIHRAAGGGLSRLGGARAVVGRDIEHVFADASRISQAIEAASAGGSVMVSAAIGKMSYSVCVYVRSDRILLTALEIPVRSPGGQAQRLQSLGRLAGGIAHDFNNVLMAVMGHAQIIERRSDDQAVRNAASTIVTAAERAAGLTEQLLGFARQGKISKEPAVVDDLVSEVCRLLGRTVDRRIRVIHRPSIVPGVVLGDPGQLQQIILNLALNARDAMPDGGELVFTTDIVEEAPTSAEVTSDLLSDTWVRLAVTDTGAGMSEAVQARVFEPYFTTKSTGTGLGLAIVKKIVLQHRGTILLHRAPAGGACFVITLPAAPKGMPPQSTDMPALRRTS